MTDRSLQMAAGIHQSAELMRAVTEYYFDWLQRSYNTGGNDSTYRSTSIGDINIFFPFGNGFTLYANPVTTWFDMLATAQPETERKIVTGVASYGKQIGWMMDVLLPLAETSDAVSEDDKDRLRQLKSDIEAVKAR